MAYESPSVAVYGYPTQLTPQEVLGMDLAPMQKAIDTTRQQQYGVNSMLVSSALERQLQDRALQAKQRIQQMRDQMMYDRLAAMENAKIAAVRQAGMNKNITDALGMAQDIGITPPARQAGMDDQAYLDSINRAIGQARSFDIKASTSAVKNSLGKMDQLARQKSTLEASVIPDAQKIALGKVGNLQQWIQQQGDPDLLAQYNAAAKAGLPAPSAVVQAYQNFAQAVFEQTKYNLLAQSGKQKQYDAIQSQMQLQGQLIHNALNAPDRFGRVAPKAYAGQIINDATTQFESDQAKAAQDAAAGAATTGKPEDIQKVTQAQADAQRANMMANTIRQHLASGAIKPDSRSLAEKAAPLIVAASNPMATAAGYGGSKFPNAAGAVGDLAAAGVGSYGPLATDLATAVFGHPGAGPITPAELAAARAKMVASNPDLASRAFVNNVLGLPDLKTVAPGTNAAPARMALPVASTPVVQTNMAPVAAASPVNVLQLPQIQQAFQSAAQSPVAVPVTPNPAGLGIGTLDNIDPASMLNSAHYAQMFNTEQ